MTYTRVIDHLFKMIIVNTKYFGFECFRFQLDKIPSSGLNSRCWQTLAHHDIFLMAVRGCIWDLGFGIWIFDTGLTI
jgi:hypothetical protein